MKKLLTALLTLALTACIVIIPVSAADTAADGTVVYVTITDSDGKTVLANEAVTVNDCDNDGVLTINDALYSAHEANYEGGAAAGYASADSEWGLSLTKLWGCENGGSYGYYVNNASAMSLSDEVKNNDHVNAFVYTDLVSYSDTYTFFSADTSDVDAGSEFTLTLTAYGWDGNSPVENAVILVNGKKTDYHTGADGTVAMKLTEAGKYTISAECDGINMVAPVFTLNVSGSTHSEPAAGDNGMVYVWTVLLIICTCTAYIAVKHTKCHEA